MLPFVVGGGILIAIAFLIDGLLVDMNSLDAAARSNFGTITPAAAMFKQIGGVAFGFMLPVLAGYIAMAIGDRPALALGFVGGMMASSGPPVSLEHLLPVLQQATLSLSSAKHVRNFRKHSKRLRRF